MSYPVNKLHLVDTSQLPVGFAIKAPASGVISEVSTLSNAIINSGCLGEGLAIALTGNKLIAPFDGVVTQMPNSGQRIVIKAKNGLKVILLFAHQNEQLMGEGFHAKVKNNTPVKAGQLIANFNLQALAQLSTNTPHYLAVMVVNAELVGDIYYSHQKVTESEDTLMTVTAKKRWILAANML